MPIYANTEAKAFWKQGHARSLAATRFVTLKTLQNGNSDDSYRKAHATQIQKGAIHTRLLENRSAFISSLEAHGAVTVFAKLEARLILNAGDGVIENGGICLDRNSGVPYIPGSAVKGCARHHAIWTLSHESDSAKVARQLVDLCLIFGYGDSEWKPGRDQKKGHSHSDFWLAMVPLENAGEEYDAERNERWEHITETAESLIRTSLGVEKFPRQLGGAVAFLPSYPDKDPGIDLDILTCHHPKYYAGEKLLATDDEDPNPVVFPVVAKGGIYRFSLLPCQRFCTNTLLKIASGYLSEGLQIFGIGAKTNAGYGWFSIDQAAALREAEKREQEIAEQEKRQYRDSLSETDRAKLELGELPHEEFVSICKNITNEEADRQKLVCSMLVTSKKEEWKRWKKQKKGEWPSIVPEIRKIAKIHNIELS